VPGEKTEKPTPKKLREARKDGNFPRTQEAATWVGVACGFALTPMSLQIAGERFRLIFAQLPAVADDPSPARAFAVLSGLPLAIILALLPACGAAVAGGVLATAIQGVYPSAKALKPDPKKLNPVNGLKRMFGPNAIWEAVKTMIKVVVIGLVVWNIGQGLFVGMLRGPMPLSVTLDSARSGITKLVWAAAAAGLLLAGADYGYQRHKVMKKLKMSLQDIKDENKQSEGDPQVKGQIRARQLAMSRNRMLANVATADVVLVNPTHLAVALVYKPGGGAPRVVAKGAGGIAAKIREHAHEHRVPVLEDKPLARALYTICEIGEEIPSELYMAVARILAFVMAAGKPAKPRPGTVPKPRKASGGTRMPDLPTRSQLRTRRRDELRKVRESR
jgi:flagellar biosynthetic protein FlhB